MEVRGAGGPGTCASERQRSQAVQQGAIQLQHVPGQSLVADGFTKQLGASPFGRFKESLGFYSGAEEVGKGQVKIVKVKKLEVGRNEQLVKVLGLLVVGSTCVELAEAKELDDDDAGGEYWLIVITAVVVLLKLIKEIGLRGGGATGKAHGKRGWSEPFRDEPGGGAGGELHAGTDGSEGPIAEGDEREDHCGG